MLREPALKAAIFAPGAPRRLLYALLGRMRVFEARRGSNPPHQPEKHPPPLPPERGEEFFFPD